MAEFIALLKAGANCFRHPRLVLGSPWKHEPYGSCCTDGTRVFIAINNPTWNDAALELHLDRPWELSGADSWDLYRWYPEPARLTGPGSSFGAKTAIAVRPFQTGLIEAVAVGSVALCARGAFVPR